MIRRQEISREIELLNRVDSHDIVRRQKIDALTAITERDLVVYAVDFLGLNPFRAQLTSGLVSISLQDKEEFDEITRKLTGPNLDVLLYSGGGSAEATESIVELLRARFSHIRFIIPDIAKSAATMMAMSGDEILMDERSELGPTDPQIQMVRDNQRISAPAQAIIDQFKTAQGEINDNPAQLPSWVPILREYGPSLLAECQNHLELSRNLVAQWLKAYMFASDPDADAMAVEVAGYLSNHNLFKSHARRVGIDDLKTRNVKIVDMRTDTALHEAVRDLHTCIMLTLSNTNAFKLVENSLHEASVRLIDIQVQQTPSPPTLQPLNKQGPTKKEPKKSRGSRS